MIGTEYWTVGIVIDREPDCERWSCHLDFLDDGFCDRDSTEGVLRCRYITDDVGRQCQVLREDAEKLGIQFGKGPSVPPMVYAKNDRADLQEEANRQGAKLGWESAYRLEVTT